PTPSDFYTGLVAVLGDTHKPLASLRQEDTFTISNVFRLWPVAYRRLQCFNSFRPEPAFSRNARFRAREREPTTHKIKMPLLDVCQVRIAESSIDAEQKHSLYRRGSRLDHLAKVRRLKHSGAFLGSFQSQHFFRRSAECFAKMQRLVDLAFLEPPIEYHLNSVRFIAHGDWAAGQGRFQPLEVITAQVRH